MLIKMNGQLLQPTQTVDFQKVGYDYLGHTVTNAIEQGAEYVSQPMNIDFVYGSQHLVSADLNPISCAVKIVGHLSDLASHLF